MKFHYFVNIIHQFLPKTIKQFNKSMNLLLFNKTWQSFCDQLVSILKKILTVIRMTGKITYSKLFAI